MNEIKNQREIALDVLNKLRVIDKDVFLAGGAVRNWYFDKPATDLDIFIDEKCSSSCGQLILSVETLLGVGAKPLGKGIGEQYACNPDLRYVVQTNYRGVDVQVIVVANRRNIVRKFPFGICQCGMDWQGRDYYTKAFLQESKYNSLVLRNPLYKNADKYVNKIRSYFPDWNFYDNVESFLEYITDNSKV